MNIHKAVKIFFSCFFKWNGSANAGIIDQEIKL